MTDLFPFLDTRNIVSNYYKRNDDEEMSHKDGQKDLALGAMQGLAALQENSNV